MIVGNYYSMQALRNCFWKNFLNFGYPFSYVLDNFKVLYYLLLNEWNLPYDVSYNFFFTLFKKILFIKNHLKKMKSCRVQNDKINEWYTNHNDLTFWVILINSKPLSIHLAKHFFSSPSKSLVMLFVEIHFCTQISLKFYNKLIYCNWPLVKTGSLCFFPPNIFLCLSLYLFMA